MPICCMCGEEFSLSTARRCIGRRFGAGTYDDEFPDGDVCEECASEEIGSNMAEGASVMECMPYEWD